MPWQCYLVTPLPDPVRRDVNNSVFYRTPDNQVLPWHDLRVGAMYRDPMYGIRVKVPGYNGTNDWKIEQPGTNGYRWTITGSIPLISVVASFNNKGVYHGILTNGILSDDVEGRKFDDFGNAVI